MKEKNILINNNGSIMVICLIMLVVLSVIGTSSSKTASTELQIAGNDKAYKKAFYLAEASAVENAQRLDNGGEEMVNLSEPTTPDWLYLESNLPDSTNITNTENWSDTYSQTSIDSDTRFLTIFNGVATGDSLDMSKSTLFTYTIFGRSNQTNSTTTIEMGYKKAF